LPGIPGNPAQGLVQVDIAASLAGTWTERIVPLSFPLSSATKLTDEQTIGGTRPYLWIHGINGNTRRHVVLDVSDPDNVLEVATFDSFPGALGPPFACADTCLRQDRNSQPDPSFALFVSGPLGMHAAFYQVGSTRYLATGTFFFQNCLPACLMPPFTYRFDVWNVTDTQNSVAVWNADWNGGILFHLAVLGNTMLSSNTTGTFLVWTLNQGIPTTTAPSVWVDTAFSTARVQRFVVYQNRLWVSWGKFGLAVYDVSNGVLTRVSSLDAFNAATVGSLTDPVGYIESCGALGATQIFAQPGVGAFKYDDFEFRSFNLSSTPVTTTVSTITTAITTGSTITTSSTVTTATSSQTTSGPTTSSTSTIASVTTATTDNASPHLTLAVPIGVSVIAMHLFGCLLIP
jgi:hypothetical protein